MAGSLLQENFNSEFESIDRAEFPFVIEKKELWTSKQRQMHPLHYSISYRASFKPELPDFFIKRYLKGKKDAIVLDPFGGRGTTVLQANLMGFKGIYNDINPTMYKVARLRQHIPSLDEILVVLRDLDLTQNPKILETLSSHEKIRLRPFFHEKTLIEILNLRNLILANNNIENAAMNCIALAGLSRLHGHSSGFFSVYSFPQISIMPAAQEKNNIRRGIQPEYRDVKVRIEKKLKQDFKNPPSEEYHKVARQNRYLNCDVLHLDKVSSNSVDLIITSPPFLDKVDYLTDNWMRAWFLGVEEKVDDVKLAIFKEPSRWQEFMKLAMQEMGRTIKKNAHIVIEVGEIPMNNKEVLNLEELLLRSLPLSVEGGTLHASALNINEQEFSKLANCWDVQNNKKGTNTNRCLIIKKY